MNRSVFGRFTIVALALAAVLSPAVPQAGEVWGRDVASGSAWRFRVYLDEKPIGYHHFYLAEFGDAKQLRSVASFEYRLMFVRLFHYEHETTETWNGNCLQSMRSQTNSNGEESEVHGRRRADAFRVAGNERQSALPECVMSFAYWNPDFLNQTRLLNSQNGDFLDVEFSEPVYEELEIQGEPRPSYRYRLAAGALNLDLWYSTENEWLGLESEVRDGRTLRYVLEESTGTLRRGASPALAGLGQ